MKRIARRWLLALLVGAVPLATLAAALGPQQASEATRVSGGSSASGLDLAAMNRAVDPCTDFYQFACGEWQTRNPIPADRPSWGRFAEVRERNYNTLRTILEQAAAGKDPATRKIGDYWASCMDEAAIEKRGATPLDALTRKISELPAVSALPEVVGELHLAGANAFFGFWAQADFKKSDVVIAQI